MIIETSDNRFYRVTETGNPDLAHVWYGYPVKRTKNGWQLTAAGQRASARMNSELVRKSATRIIEA